MKRNSACQRYETPVVTLCTIAASSGTAPVTFMVPTPDSRLRTKISVLYIPPAGSFPLSGFAGNTLWLAEAEWDRSGVSGILLPCTNVEGTSAAPTAIPETAGLLGYSREFVSSSDAIIGHATFSANGPIVQGSWVLQCRYAPQAVRFTPEEWDEITRQCTPTLTSQIGRIT